MFIVSVTVNVTVIVAVTGTVTVIIIIIVIIIVIVLFIVNYIRNGNGIISVILSLYIYQRIKLKKLKNNTFHLAKREENCFQRIVSFIKNAVMINQILGLNASRSKTGGYPRI